jgi:uncharacterized protein (TIGR03067 family)
VKFASLVLSGSIWLLSSDGSQEEVRKHREMFQGSWSYVSLVHNGKNIPAKDLEEFRCIFRGDQFTFKVAQLVTMHGVFSLDSSKTLKTVDFKPTDRLHKGQKLMGIYELKGDQLRICYASAGHERPTEFKAEPESNRTLLLLRKEKS